MCDQLIKYSYQRVDGIMDLNLSSVKFKKLICYTAQVDFNKIYSKRNLNSDNIFFK